MIPLGVLAQRRSQGGWATTDEVWARFDDGTIEVYPHPGATWGSTLQAREDLVQVYIPTGVTSIGNSAFFGCTSLALTELPAGLTSIDSYAFYGCTSLALTELPTGVTSISVAAFGECTSLTLIELPAGLTSIGDGAFFGCISLALVTCHAVAPPTLGGTDVFTDTHPPLSIRVPAESVASYQAATNWSTWAARIAAI